MKAIKTTLLLFSAFSLLINPIITYAEPISESDITISIMSDKEEYGKNDDIEVTVSVTNESDVELENVKLKNETPSGYTLKDESYQSELVKDKLSAGDTVKLTTKYKVKDSGNQNTGTDNSQNNNTNNRTNSDSSIANEDNTASTTTTTSANPTISTIEIKDESTALDAGIEQTDSTITTEQDDVSKTTGVKTGDENYILFWAIVFSVCLAIIITVIIKRKEIRKILSILLCVLLVTEMCGNDLTVVKAAEVPKPTRTITIHKTIKIDGSEYELTANVTLPEDTESNTTSEVDSDGDGLSDVFEVNYGTDKNNKDTDGDGLSDYLEYQILYTNALLVDTDGNGIDDGDEDTDHDGLTNKYELSISTKPEKSDTDNDGLSDGEEEKYGCNPTKYDTDKDDLSDGEEITLGLDPINPKTDGITLDSERTFSQTLSISLIDEDLLSDENEIKPYLYGTLPSIIDNHVSVGKEEIVALSDNRAVVGNELYIDTDYTSENELMLGFDCSKVSEIVGLLLICKYDEGNIEPLETTIDGTNISAKVGKGYYFVMNAEQLLVDLDINIEKYIDYSAKSRECAPLATAFYFDENTNDVDSSWYDENYVLVDENGEIVSLEENIAKKPTTSDKMIHSKEETASEETTIEETASEETTTEETVSEETTTEETVSEETTTEQTVSEETATEQTVSEETTTKETASEETTTEQTASEETTTEETASSADVTSLSTETESVNNKIYLTETEIIYHVLNKKDLTESTIETCEDKSEIVETKDHTSEINTSESSKEETAEEVITTEVSEETDIIEETSDVEEISEEETETITATEETEEVDLSNCHYVLASSLYNTFSTTNLEIDKISGQADIVFVIDTTGSMSGAINNVVRNIDNFVDELSAKSVQANFALVDYKDITCRGEYTRIIKNGSSNWFSDVTALKQKINSIYVSGGGDYAETTVDALAAAYSLDFRKNASKFIILITDAPYKVDNNYGISSMDEMVSKLKDANIITSVITTSSCQYTYKSVYEETNGIYGNIYSNFYTLLLSLADKIGEVVNDGTWVILKNYQIVKLNNPVAIDSGDTDGDGKSDYEELGKKMSLDLTPFITLTLKFYDVPYTLYTGQTSINVYDYVSNPTMKDTDYDGIQDNVDKYPKSNSFTASMYTDQIKSNVSVKFKLDIRPFFGSNTTYDSNLSVVSELMATSIYKNNSITISGSDLTMNNDNDLKLNLEYLAFNDVVDETMSTYGIHKTEYAFCHKDITYGEKALTLVPVIIRGTNGTSDEWDSNFDIGNTSDKDSTAGWTTASNHKGFDIATTGVLEKLDDYVKNIDTKNEIVYWVTGHSRGAGIANLIGAYLTDEGKTAFTYTFAAPATTTSENAKDSKYDCIFNILNYDDFVPKLPMPQWGFGLYGKTTKDSVRICDTYEKEWETLVDNFDYNNDRYGMTDTLNALSSISTSRNNCYVISLEEEKGIHKSYNSSDKRDKKCNAIISNYPTNTVNTYQVKKSDSSKSYKFDIYQSPMFLMNTLSAVMAKDYSAGSFAALDVAPYLENAKWAIVKSYLGGIQQPHFLESYYVLAKNVKVSDFN